MNVKWSDIAASCDYMIGSIWEGALLVVIAIVWSTETREMTIDANTGPSKLKMGLVLRQKVNHLILRGMIPFSNKFLLLVC